MVKMKKLITLIALVALSAAAFAQSSKDIYEKYSGKDDVRSVYISPAMFGFLKILPDINLNGNNGDKVNITELVRSFDGMYILSTSASSQVRSLSNDIAKLSKGNKYQLLMETKEYGNSSKIYTIQKKDIISDLVIINETDGGLLSFVAITGQIPASELENIISK